MAPVERERPERLKPIGEWKGESLSSVDGISSGGDLKLECGNTRLRLSRFGLHRIQIVTFTAP